MLSEETTPLEIDEILVQASGYIEPGATVRHGTETYTVVETAVRSDRSTDPITVTARLRRWPPDPAADERRRLRREAQLHRERLAHRAEDLGTFVRFRDAEAMRRRADHKQQEFLAAVDEWLAHDSFDLVQDRLSDLEYALRLRFVRPAPLLLWADEASDALSRWRKALNYLVHDLAKSRQVEPTSLRRPEIQYPVYADSRKFEEWVARIQQLGGEAPLLSEAQIRAMRRWQPFEDGEMLQLLQEADNQAKHRSRLQLDLEVKAWTHGCDHQSIDEPPTWSTRRGPVDHGSVVSTVSFARPVDGVEVHGSVRLHPVIRRIGSPFATESMSMRAALVGVRNAAVLAFHELAHAS